MKHTISIYGAQLFACTIYEAIKSLYRTKVSFFIVSDISENPESIDGIKVISLEDYIRRGIFERILIATPEEHHKNIGNKLIKHGRVDYIYLTSELRNHILREYYGTKKKFDTLTGLRDIVKKENDFLGKLDDIINKEFMIYMARSSKDKVLDNFYTLPSWIIQIHAGAISDNKEIGMIRDDLDNHISNKNRSYCELTVLYWIWKNTKHMYTGICHYRRVFSLNHQDISNIIQFEPDVILPYPSIHFPDITVQYGRYLSDQEIQLMKEAIFFLTPEIRPLWNHIWNSRYFLNYNMLIAKRDVLDKYCTWLFSILEMIEKMSYERNIIMSMRYAGYLGEILETIYFQYYKKNYKVMYTGVDILL